MHGNRETSGAPESNQQSGRSGEDLIRNPDKHVPEESDCVEVSKKAGNKAEARAYEAADRAERRTQAKENMGQTHTDATQIGRTVQSGLGRVRERAKRDKKQS